MSWEMCCGGTPSLSGEYFSQCGLHSAGEFVLRERIHKPSSLIGDLSQGTVRGQIVLISGQARQSGGCYLCGLNADAIVQNEFGGPATAFEMDEKWAGIQLHSLIIYLGNPGTIYENSLTGSTAGVYPIDLANSLLGYEGMAYRYLKHIFAGNIHPTTGLLYMDFPGSGLIGGILATSMRSRKLRGGWMRPFQVSGG